MANQFPNYQYYSQQYSQPIFPQPQGNLYMINSSLEVANVPMGAGVSMALCFPENLCYLKSMQNGSPVFRAYKIIPYDQEDSPSQTEQQLDFTQILKNLDERLKNLEQSKKGGRLDELL